MSELDCKSTWFMCLNVLRIIPNVFIHLDKKLKLELTLFDTSDSGKLKSMEK